MTFHIIGVIGAGTMGNGIAQVCAQAGFTTILQDISDATLTKAELTMSSSLDRAVKKGTLTEEGKSQILARITRTTQVQALSQADIIIETATENEGLKLKILQSIDAIAKPEAIIASNTSSISITKLAAATTRPEKFVGMHFFNPVPVMALVEIITGLKTSEATALAVAELARALGKTPIGVKNSAGFVVNRILCPMINEAIFALQEGLASAQEIDAGMQMGCNHPIGPLALCDLVGLDVQLAVMDVLYNNFNDPKYRPAPLLREMVDAGMLGRKSGRGFYTYTK
jgi:3-hydroxybutyryl-CoA dehydrogenase